MAICEELQAAYFMLKFLTWGNIRDESADYFPRLRTAHISPIFVHDFENLGKKPSRGQIRSASPRAFP